MAVESVTETAMIWGNRKRCKHVGNGDISAIIREFTHIFRYLYL